MLGRKKIVLHLKADENIFAMLSLASVTEGCDIFLVHDNFILFMFTRCFPISFI